MPKRRFGALAVLALLLPALVAADFLGAEPADAAVASDFNPAYIISDDLFYDGNAMSAAEIQSFLDSKIGTCQTDRCLNVAVLPVTGRAASYSADTGGLVCNAIAGGTMRASELIYRTQVACGISAKVILVTLQKEQGLVTSRAPSDWALRAAMGMGCPDTAPCSDAFAGLATQIMSGTRQLNVYKVGRFGRQPGVQYIQYHPNAACGGTTINVANYATAALYNYTPYQPNAAALANLTGTGDGCSSYGNRNFWRFYSDWFGNPMTGEGPGAKAISQAWANVGGMTGEWGNRVYWMPCSLGVTCGHVFENVYVGWVADRGIFIARGKMKDWVLAQGIGVVGSPDSPEVAVTQNGGGIAQSFSLGLVNWGPAGPFVVSGGIRDEHARLGGVGASSGWPTSAMTCDGSGYCTQGFQHAVIGSRPDGVGISVVDPEVLAYYLGRGGPSGSLGAPQTSPAVVTQNGGGTQQAFQNGLVNETPRGIFTITSTFRDAQGAAGGVGGRIGWPTGEEVCSGGVCSQTFEHALFLARGTSVITMSDPDLISYFSTAGGVAGALGFPLTDKVTVPSSSPNGGGWQMPFERGLVESSAAGTFTVKDAIRDAHGRSGGVAGPLGWPTSEQSCSGGVCTQSFQNGAIYVAGSGTPRLIASTAITSYYIAAGGPSGRLGLPITDTVPVPSSSPNGGGVQVAFQNGLVESSSVGTFVLTDMIRDAHGRSGGVAGPLGWPKAEQVCSDGSCTQAFQNGIIWAEANWVARTIASPEIASYYQEAGGSSGSLGYPVTDSVPVPASSPNGGGMQVAFQYGLVETSASGTFTLRGAIRDAHGSLGGVAGPLGWPTSEQSCSGGACSQQFQKGRISVSAAGKVQTTYTISDPAIAAYYQAAGGATGPLGYPLTGAVAVPASSPNGGGVQVAFQFGLVESSPAGTFTLKDAIRDAHGRSGGVAGPLGWPTGEQTCAGGVCTQSFQNGLIFLGANGIPRVMASSAIADYFRAAGGATGSLGAPITDTVPVPASSPNGGGVQVAFQYGLVETSAAGTFLLKDGIRDVHARAGGVAGPYGWPIAEQVCTTMSCSQSFQNGKITVPR